MVLRKLNEIPEKLLRIDKSSSATKSINPDIDLVPRHYAQVRSVSVYGPTSIYDESMLASTYEHGSTPSTSVASNTPDSISSPIVDPNIKVAKDHKYIAITSPVIRPFLDVTFKYLDTTFTSFLIHKEKTLKLYDELCALDPNDYQKYNELLYRFPDNQFLSPELIYSLSAIGASMMSKLEEAEYFYELLKNIVFLENYPIPTPSGRSLTEIPTPLPASRFAQVPPGGAKPGPQIVSMRNSSFPRMQTLLLLALYELSKGELTSSWQFTGMAFRMGIDVGFDNSNKKCIDPDLSKLKNKLYWGCFIIDNFLGLIYGRNKMMIFQPDYPIYENDCNNPNLSTFVLLITLSEPMFGTIYYPMPFKNFEESKRNFIIRFNTLQDYNQQLLDWRNNLAPEFYWDKKTLQEKSDNTNYALQFTYYLVVIVLNKPFLQISKSSDVLSIIEMVDEFEIILRLAKDPMYNQNIVTIYLLILMSNILFLYMNHIRSKSAHKKTILQIKYFIEFLTENFDSKVWLVVRNPIAILNKRLEILEQNSRLFTKPHTALGTTSAEAVRREMSANGKGIKTDVDNRQLSANLHDGDVPQYDPFIKMLDSLFNQQSADGSAPVRGEDNGALFYPPYDIETFNNVLSFEYLDINWENYFNQENAKLNGSVPEAYKNSMGLNKN